MRGEPEGEALEVVPLEDVAPPPPLHRPVVAWVERHRRAVLAAALGLAVLGTAHALLAVRGARSLERQVRSAVVLRAEFDDYVADLSRRSSSHYELLAQASYDERVERVAGDYAARVAELAERAGRVVAVDHGGRRLRRDATGRLRAEAAAARRAGSRGFSSREVTEASRLVERYLRRGGLRAGDQPNPPPLAAVSAMRKGVPLLDERTHTRLFATMPDGVLEVDVDTGTATPVGRRGISLGAWVPADGFAGSIVEGEGLIVPYGSGGPGRSVGRYDEVLPDADDTSRVWFVSWPDHPLDARPAVVHAFDGRGVRRGELFPGRGGAVVGLSDRWLARQAFDQREGVSFEVVDRRGDAPVAERREGAVLALRGDVLAWTDETRLLVRTLPASGDRVVAPPGPGLVPGPVAVSRDGKRLAVVWIRLGPGRAHEVRVAVHDVASLGLVAVLRVGDDSVLPLPAWSRGSDWLFLLESRNVGRGRVLAWREGLAEPKHVLVQGQFYALWAF